MMGDLRSRAKIPYGYRIVDGVAVIDTKEAFCLKLYFKRFLEGLTMSAAAKEAGLPCSPAALPHFFRRKEYPGTDYYPPLITEEYHNELIREYESRKGRGIRAAQKHPGKGVRIHTEFRLERPSDFEYDDPADYAEELFRRIRPQNV